MTAEPDRLELTDPEAYVAKLKAILGGRDPVETLAKTPETLKRITTGITPEIMRTRPFPGKWTPSEILGHLLDTDWVFGYRIRAILGDDRPIIIGMDQEKWVDAQRYNERDPAEVLDDFTAIRRQNVAVWRRMHPGDLERTCRHDERGEESLATMLLMEAGHDLSHIDQIQRYLAAIQQK